MHVLTAMWYAAIAVRTVAAYRMAGSRLSERFPLLLYYLSSSALVSIILAIVRSRPKIYLAAYAAATPINLLFEGFLIVSIFWALTLNYRNFQTFGSILLGCLALIGIAAAWTVAQFSAPLSTLSAGRIAWDAAQLAQRYVSVAMAVVLVGARFLLPRYAKVPIPIHAQRFASALMLNAFLGLIAAVSTRVWGFQHPLAPYAISCCFSLAVSGYWLFAVRPAVDIPMEDVDFEELEREGRKGERDLHLVLTRLRYFRHELKGE